eukprot:CAMPEP_0181056892 /NCGR_PEP_ID=MMETSP1070-20121207/19957_1 /TAXON_ID=265543 /ORGANISM="Minutocellus polymorphus, Strain NH13" /LENGTH=379 /DNA_ID=CAMNT_0023136265 /DNA_START=24 /DNA_END=1163 /DNA_ORIENTATION=+
MSKENDAAGAAEVDLTRFFGDDDEICPICLDVMPLFTHRGTERTRSVCCGKLTCADCVKDLRGHQAKSIEKMHARAQDPNTASDDHAMERARRQVAQSLSCSNCRAKMPQTPKENFEMVKEHAENGHAWAQHSLGTKYESGKGVAVNPKKAAKWFKRAAEQGHPWAMSSYGHCLRSGRGVRADVKEAMIWFEKSAATGHAISQYYVGDVILYGTDGIPQDKERAVHMLKLSANQGHDPAQCLLGNSYDFGDGVEGVDKEKALYWYEKSAAQGNATGMNNVGATLLSIAQGKYGTVDILGKSPIPRAMKWFRKAAAAGDPDAPRMVMDLQIRYSSFCINCQKMGDKLSQCSKCKVVRYCGRDCQLAHWNAGHKKDCCKQT